jgi:hypothetical protein
MSRASPERHLLKSAPALAARAQHIAQRIANRLPFQDALADLIDARTCVRARRERIRSATESSVAAAATAPERTPSAHSTS